MLRAYNRQRLGSFVVQLGGGAEVERAALLQEKGDQRRRILRLLTLHEPKESAQVLAELDEPGELTRCAELFIEHGYPDEGHSVVEAAATRGRPGRLQVLTWLYGQAIREADDKAAATWAEEIFREAPTVEHWGLLRASARGRSGSSSAMNSSMLENTCSSSRSCCPRTRPARRSPSFVR